MVRWAVANIRKLARDEGAQLLNTFQAQETALIDLPKKYPWSQLNPDSRVKSASNCLAKVSDP